VVGGRLDGGSGLQIFLSLCWAKKLVDPQRGRLFMSWSSRDG